MCHTNLKWVDFGFRDFEFQSKLSHIIAKKLDLKHQWFRNNNLSYASFQNMEMILNQSANVYFHFGYVSSSICCAYTYFILIRRE